MGERYYVSDRVTDDHNVTMINGYMTDKDYEGYDYFNFLDPDYEILEDMVEALK